MKHEKKDESWKIINKSTMASYSLTNIFRLLWIAKFKLSFRYIPRFLWVLCMSTITLPLRIIEQIRFHRKIKKTKVTKDPIFIIGFYRTATTLLHILFSKDPQLGYLSNLDGFTALFNLSFSKTARRFLEKRLPATRPMDNIEMLIDGPQEESYAVANVSKYGLPNAIIFPRKYEYFAQFLDFEECSPKDLQKWKTIYHRIVQKLTLKHGGKQIVLKDPANAARIKHLLKMYPNAKFIYNYRNPYPLLCSLKLLFQKLLELTALQTWDKETYEQQFTSHIDKFYSAFKESKALISPENFYELKYEDFTQAPLEYLEKIYKKFKLGDFEQVRPIFQEYLTAKKNYKTNTHVITPKIIQTVNTHLEDYRVDHGYERLNPESLEKGESQ